MQKRNPCTFSLENMGHVLLGEILTGHSQLPNREIDAECHLVTVSWPHDAYHRLLVGLRLRHWRALLVGMLLLLHSQFTNFPSSSKPNSKSRFSLNEV